MIKENYVSLWLGHFESNDDFNNYIEVKYDADGNSIISPFQNDFGIVKYNYDTTESDWISESCTDVNTLLAGFSYDDTIISKFDNIISTSRLEYYNSILLLYNFEFEMNTNNNNAKMDYIGCVSYIN